MREPDKNEIEEQCREIQRQLDSLLSLVQKMVPEKEYYTPAEFARKKGISKKTVWNYISKGKYDHIRKINGKTEIHNSEL